MGKKKNKPTGDGGAPAGGAPSGGAPQQSGDQAPGPSTRGNVPSEPGPSQQKPGSSGDGKKTQKGDKQSQQEQLGAKKPQQQPKEDWRAQQEPHGSQQAQRGPQQQQPRGSQQAGKQGPHGSQQDQPGQQQQLSGEWAKQAPQQGQRQPQKQQHQQKGGKQGPQHDQPGQQKQKGEWARQVPQGSQQRPHQPQKQQHQQKGGKQGPQHDQPGQQQQRGEWTKQTPQGSQQGQSGPQKQQHRGEEGKQGPRGFQQGPSQQEQQQREERGKQEPHGSQPGYWGGAQGGKGLQQQQLAPREQQPGQGQRPGAQAGQGQRPGAQQGRQTQQAAPSIQPATSKYSITLPTPSADSVGRGTIGRPGTVEVNYLSINTDKMPAVAYQYYVDITPDLPKKFLRPAFDQFNRQFFSDIKMAYDGQHSFYTIQKLPVESCAKEVVIGDTGSRQKTFKVSIKETVDMEIDMNSLRNYFKERIYDKPMRALQCVEVVLANPCHLKGIRAGRSFFLKPKEYYDLRDGYEMWTGLYQAAILGDKPFLNVDISHKSFPSACKLIDHIRNNCRVNNLNENLGRNIFNLKTFLKSVNIVYEPPANFGSFPRTYKVLDVTDQSAVDLKVKLDDGTTVTVDSYFTSKGYKLQYPRLNCLKVGSTVKSINLPIELCSIPAGQAINKKDGQAQVQQMIRFAATSTNVRKEKIMNMLREFQHNNDIKVKGFGIEINMQFQVVPMRILKSPEMEYFAREMIRPARGSWRMNDNTKFLATKQLANGHQWAVLYSKKSRISHGVIQNFFGMVSSLAKKLNMCLSPNIQIFTFDNILTELRNFRAKNYNLVFVVIPRFGTSYADIKQAAELKVGMLTQCIQENTIERRNDMQTVANILLKVNGKLNGTNHRINPDTNIKLQNIMFLGADVTHPSPDQKHIPSVVGVAASHDANGACYNMQYRLQRSTCENIEDMDAIFSHHLRVYFQYQGKYPDHIIYYRDGVSDGQFPIVKRNELRDIRSACTKVRCSAKLTCIVAIKRHHTRFFPQTVNQRDKFNNVEPGTVVDRVITHPNEVQFFMVSHQSIQGTAKPTRYNVIEDDAKMNINDLQTLTYNMCHMFPRCNRVVSYPAPAYLAHLVAFRGRVYIEGENRFSDPKKEYEKRLVDKDFMKINPMYFI